MTDDLEAAEAEYIARLKMLRNVIQSETEFQRILALIEHESRKADGYKDH